MTFLLIWLIGGSLAAWFFCKAVDYVMEKVR